MRKWSDRGCYLISTAVYLLLLRKCVLTSRDLKYDTCFDVVDGIFHGEENMILEDMSVLIL